MTQDKVPAATLRTLEPLGSLSETRLGELAALVFVEHVSRNLDPFRMQGVSGQSVYLLRGEIALTLKDGSSTVVVGGTGDARYPLGRKAPFESAKAITDIDLVRIDDDLLDIMATWDQLAGGTERRAPEAAAPSLQNWALLTGMFSVNNLRTGAFAQLPPAHIEALLRRFARIPVKRGQAIVRESEPGDYYYVIETGKCEVERTVGGARIKLAQLKAGDAFGEEALVSGAKRNATVTMITDGALFRLDQKDFNELLREPLLQRVSMAEAQAKVAAGAQWLDVRYPSEYQFDKLPGAINIPVAEIRDAARLLDTDREYVVYCQSGRRSSAAAFLLAQRGYKAFLLEGGLWGGERRGAGGAR